MERRSFILISFILLLSLAGCSQRYSRSYDPATSDHTISGNLYQNTAYGFILVAPNSNWTYAGVPSRPLIVRTDTGTVARFTRELTPTVTAFIEVAIWDISGTVTPGMFTADVASLNADLISADTDRFPSYNALSDVSANPFNDIYAYEHEFTAYATTNIEEEVIQNRYRCVSFRSQTDDFDRLFVIIGGTEAGDWGSRSAEITSYITSFHYN